MLFDIPNRSDKAADKAIISKVNKKVKTVAKSIHSGLASRISEITLRVNQVLGEYKNKYIIIRDETRLIDYINTCIENNVISIDTETTGLDPLQDDIVGICIYTPKSKAAYIPINHISYITNKKLDNQLSVETIRNAFLPIIEKPIDVIMFNAVFDIRFLRNTIGLKDIYCTWDCYLASRLLNENEPQKGLKALHKKYVLKGKSDAFSFDELFKGITFNLIPIETAYLYAAHDPEITYELYEFQKPFLTVDNEVCIRKDLQGVAYVFHNIEMPCVQVVCDMEDNGIEFDFEYNKQLSEKYNKLLQESKDKFYSICDKYKDKIESYKLKNPKHGLENPININSPTQLSKLIYDILKLPQPQDKRSTGEDALKKIGGDLCNAILDYRTLSKLVDTYIDKLPNCVNPKDGRVHCNFNAYGADTGRMSSTNPNLQNIPSHNKDIRKMFKAAEKESSIDINDNTFKVYALYDIMTADGWKRANTIKVGACLIFDLENGDCQKSIVTSTVIDGDYITFICE